MNRKRKPAASGRNVRWIRKDTVWNVKAKRMIRRKDGRPFVFPIWK